MMRVLVWSSPYINMALKPFGLIVWIDYDVGRDDENVPVLIPVGASIGHRPAGL